MISKAAPRRRVATPEDTEREAAHSATIARIEERRAAPREEDDPEQRFARARALERAVEAGEALTQAQADWLSDYRQSSEYRARLRLEGAR